MIYQQLIHPADIGPFVIVISPSSETHQSRMCQHADNYRFTKNTHFISLNSISLDKHGCKLRPIWSPEIYLSSHSLRLPLLFLFVFLYLFVVLLLNLSLFGRQTAKKNKEERTQNERREEVRERLLQEKHHLYVDSKKGKLEEKVRLLIFLSSPPISGFV